MKTFKIIFYSIISALLGSCSIDNRPAVSPAAKDPIEEPSSDVESPRGPAAFRKDLAEEGLTQELAQTIEASNRIGLDLLTYFSTETEDNVLISPMSFTFAMGLLAEGTAGNTREDICRFFDSRITDFESFCLNLKVHIERLKNNAIIRFADLVAVNENYTIKDAYKNAIVSWYDGQIQLFDFHQAKTLQDINSWVIDRSNGLIGDILESINPSATAYLINTLFFDAVWRDKFNPNFSHEGKFYPEKGEPFLVTMMSNEKQYPYAEQDGLICIELPYENGDYLMDILIPSEAPLSTVLQDLSLPRIHSLISSQATRTVRLSLPRFTICSRHHYNDYLIKNGLASIYDNPDLSGMLESGTGEIADIFQ